MRAFSMSKSAAPIFSSRLGELLQHAAGLVDLGAHLLDDLLGLGDLGIEVLQCRHRALSPGWLRWREYMGVAGD